MKPQYTHYKISRIRGVHKWLRKATLVNRWLQYTIFLPIPVLGTILFVFRELLKVAVKLLDYLLDAKLGDANNYLCCCVRYVFTFGKDPEFRLHKLNEGLFWHDEYVRIPMRRRRMLSKHKDTPDTEIPEDWK